MGLFRSKRPEICFTEGVEMSCLWNYLRLDTRHEGSDAVDYCQTLVMGLLEKFCSGWQFERDHC